MELLAAIITMVLMACGGVGWIILLILLYVLDLVALVLSLINGAYEWYLVPMALLALAGPYLGYKLFKRGLPFGTGNSSPGGVSSVKTSTPAAQNPAPRAYSIPKKSVSLPGVDHSYESPLGGMTHCDKSGKVVSRSYRNAFGGYDHYDASGKQEGYSMPGLFGGYDHYDSHGHKTGYSMPDVFGGYIHYDAHGKEIGRSNESVFGGYYERK